MKNRLWTSLSLQKRQDGVAEGDIYFFWFTSPGGRRAGC